MQGLHYWLLRALELRPGHLETLIAYAQYLQPRWGGSYEDIDGLVSGPLCKTLTEPLRNAIRWAGLWEELSDFPQPVETQAVPAHRQAFESFLQRDLRPLEHGEAMGRFANFISYSLGDHVGASIACAERGEVPGEYIFRQRGRAVPQFRARDADSRTCCGACS